MRCNCDASCGENRYHNVGDRECRFRTVKDYEAYWGIQTAVPSEQKLPKNYASMKSPGVKVMEEMPKHSPYIESMKRPWGEWHVLDVDQGYKVKRLEILPDQAISLQYHKHRSEHWTIVQGEGKVIVDGSIFTVKKGESFHVPKLSLHKIANTHLTETLIAIEVQMGEICSEDDIVRC
jgi:mannose-6-phosphate isomerase-like protein (cupin superfamily)